MTDEQAQQLLLALYDFVEQHRYLWALLRQEIRASGTLDEDRVLELLGHSLSELAQAEQRILDGEAWRIYHDYCMGCAQRLATAAYDEPVLRVEGGS